MCRNFPQLELRSGRLGTSDALLWERMTDFVKMLLIAVFKFSYSLEAGERITVDDNSLKNSKKVFPQDQ